MIIAKTKSLVGILVHLSKDAISCYKFTISIAIKLNGSSELVTAFCIIVKPPLSRPLTNSTSFYGAWPHKVNFLLLVSYVCWSRVCDLCKLCIQHATTVFTQSAPSGFTPFWLASFPCRACERGYLLASLRMLLFANGTSFFNTWIIWSFLIIYSITKNKFKFEWPYFTIF